ncbi:MULTISPECIES: hypothetical protein [Streptomyces]|uniref:hypothetical protein n=1 Tax=Streptomyces TaxID=1883 RepID=UPI001CCA6EC2|nr:MULTISPECIES: hypothetical protein [Streptomyces]UBI39352.1 hypothetical protein K7I03_24740 [Streptomyces mobaraensis]UKW31932.1 hypothetical protein MCU78_24675 [Streptomyces sp. TYQ1024]
MTDTPSAPAAFPATPFRAAPVAEALFFAGGAAFFAAAVPAEGEAFPARAFFAGGAAVFTAVFFTAVVFFAAAFFAEGAAFLAAVFLAAGFPVGAALEAAFFDTAFFGAAFSEGASAPPPAFAVFPAADLAVVTLAAAFSTTGDFPAVPLAGAFPTAAFPAAFFAGEAAAFPAAPRAAACSGPGTPFAAAFDAVFLAGALVAEAAFTEAFFAGTAFAAAFFAGARFAAAFFAAFAVPVPAAPAITAPHYAGRGAPGASHRPGRPDEPVPPGRQAPAPRSLSRTSPP